MTLSDRPLLDEMMGELKKNQTTVCPAAVLTIVRSKQFRIIEVWSDEDE